MTASTAVAMGVGDTDASFIAEPRTATKPRKCTVAAGGAASYGGSDSSVLATSRRKRSCDDAVGRVDQEAALEGTLQLLRRFVRTHQHARGRQETPWLWRHDRQAHRQAAGGRRRTWDNKCELLWA